MYTVIDIIEHRWEWLRHHPELPQEEGIFAVLGPVSVLAPLRKPIRAKVTRPDGSSALFEDVEIRYGAKGVVGIFFYALDAKDIPRGSVIQLSQ